MIDTELSASRDTEHGAPLGGRPIVGRNLQKTTEGGTLRSFIGRRRIQRILPTTV